MGGVEGVPVALKLPWAAIISAPLARRRLTHQPITSPTSTRPPRTTRYEIYRTVGAAVPGKAGSGTVTAWAVRPPPFRTANIVETETAACHGGVGSGGGGASVPSATAPA